jgi:GNAT superfamily N-acetyltransferase
MKEPMRIEAFGGEKLGAILPALARLRVEVFRAWPYLYDGDTAYEQKYLETYMRSRTAAVFVALDGDEPVGATTCLSLAEETDNILAPFNAQGIDPATVCYFGESVLRTAYRGQGIGVRFFELREAHGKSLPGCDMAAFCAVDRPDAHPAKPADFVKLDTFWGQRGFTQQPGMTCDISWKDVGDTRETSKTMVFWTKALRS